MSKTKTLFTIALLVLLGSMGAAQAQAQATLARVTLLTAPEAGAREGGKAEAAGDVFLDLAGTQASVAGYTLTYSVPIANSEAELNVLAGYDGDASDLEKGEIAFGALTGGDLDTVIAITGVTLDVSKADSGPVTVTLELENAEGDLALLVGSNTATVVTEILPGAKATAKAGTIRTRGGTATATFTIEPGFMGAFEVGQRVEFEVQGLPEAVDIAMVAADAEPPDNAESDPKPAPRVVMGAATLTGDADADDKSVTLTLGVATVTDPTMDTAGALSDGVTLTLTLTTDDEDVSLPLTVGEITARVTLIDTVMGTDTFDDAFTSPMSIFTIRTSQCTLLFPVVSVLPAGGWDSALSITNPGYKTTPRSEIAPGGLTFTFYGMDNPAVVYDTTLIPNPPGDGLEADGTLAPGGTYQVLASQILTATDWGATFRGHVHVTANYTNCSGLGWVTDFMGVNQAYTATVIDSDTGVNP